MEENAGKPQIGDDLAVAITKFATALKPETLLALLRKLGIPFETPDKARGKKNVAEAIVSEVAKFDNARQEEIGRKLELLRSIGKERKTHAVMVTFCKLNNVSAPEDFEDASGLEKAAWCYAHLPDDLWEKLDTQTYYECLRNWRGYNLAFKEDPESGMLTKHKADLEREVSDYFRKNEYRGGNCESQCYWVGEKECIVFLMTDHQNSARFWSKENAKYVNLGDVNLAPSFTIVVTFNASTSRMNILYPSMRNSTGPVCAKICKIVCETAFGKGACERKAVKYDLSSLLASSELPKVEGSKVEEAKVLRVDIALDPNNRSIRSYCEKEGDIKERIREELDLLRRQGRGDDISVLRGQVRILYKLNPSDSNCHKKTVDLTPTTIGMNNAPSAVQKLITAYIENPQTGLMPNGNNQTAGG